MKKVGKLKYLGCYFYERTCGIDFSYGIRKFYGNFNNVMSVVGYYRNEIATLHLIRVIVYLLYCMDVKRGI